VQACRILTIYLAGRAAHVPLSAVPYFVMGPLLFLVMLVPFTINGFAIRESFFVSFLTQLGIDPDRAFITGFLYFLLSVALAAPGTVLLGLDSLRGLLSARPGPPPEDDAREPERDEMDGHICFLPAPRSIGPAKAGFFAASGAILANRGRCSYLQKATIVRSLAKADRSNAALGTALDEAKKRADEVAAATGVRIQGVLSVSVSVGQGWIAPMDIEAPGGTPVPSRPSKRDRLIDERHKLPGASTVCLVRGVSSRQPGLLAARLEVEPEQKDE